MSGTPHRQDRDPQPDGPPVTVPNTGDVDDGKHLPAAGGRKAALCVWSGNHGDQCGGVDRVGAVGRAESRGRPHHLPPSLLFPASGSQMPAPARGPSSCPTPSSSLFGEGGQGGLLAEQEQNPETRRGCRVQWVSPHSTSSGYGVPPLRGPGQDQPA